MKTEIILYVRDQSAAERFFTAVLETAPRLNVPGMTEYLLGEGCVLGLMPEKGIKRLLGQVLPDPEAGHGIPRAELYLTVADPIRFHQRALACGAKELSPLLPRDWGDRAAYSLTEDGHVLVFAEPINVPGR